MVMAIRWIKCQGEVWCKLRTVDLSHSHFDNRGGIYVIWHGGLAPATVYVGQASSFRDRLGHHRRDPAIQSYQHYDLYVTWASVDPMYRNGIERYVGEALNPIIGKNFPTATEAIRVNLPW